MVPEVPCERKGGEEKRDPGSHLGERHAARLSEPSANPFADGVSENEKDRETR